MKKEQYSEELSKCVRCGTCKSLCPTYLLTLNETMGARGRVAMLGELGADKLRPTKKLADLIYSCMLCGACKGLCPAGIDIPEIMYQGRSELMRAYKRGKIARGALKRSLSRMDVLLPFMSAFQKMKLFGSASYGNIPPMTSKPFKNGIQVYKPSSKIGRIAIFAGCSVNYFYPSLGRSLVNIANRKGFEVVVFKNEICCGAPLRSLGLDDEVKEYSKKNIEHFNKVRAEAIVSLCPTCTMVIRDQYPDIAGDRIHNIMDVNEFILKYELSEGASLTGQVATYHDPCHLSFGLGISKAPRDILKGMNGLKYIEMNNAEECCGFAGLFSMHFKDMSEAISKKKIQSIEETSASTVITSCPGCIMQLEGIMKRRNLNIKIMHIVEVIEEAMQK
jgi:glycolate oxidase iron-sulfur subunit